MLLGTNLHSAFGLELAIAGVNLGGQDVGQIGLGPAPGAEAGAAAEHHQPRTLLDGVGQELVLARGQVLGGKVAEHVDVVPARRELGVVDLAGLAPRGTADHHAFHLDVGRGHDRTHQVLVIPGEVRALQEHHVQSAAQDRDERADLVVGRHELAVERLDPEGDLLLARRLGDVLQAR